MNQNTKSRMIRNTIKSKAEAVTIIIGSSNYAEIRKQMKTAIKTNDVGIGL